MIRRPEPTCCSASLAPLLLGDFETSVLANTRRVELVHRRALDRRRLADFLPRPGQLRAFEALLDQSAGGPWALHYLGVGGVGKTTLIRHLTADLAPARGVVTSRIARRQISLFRQAHEQLQEINAAARPGAPPVTVSSPAFASAERTWSAACLPRSTTASTAPRPARTTSWSRR